MEIYGGYQAEESTLHLAAADVMYDGLVRIEDLICFLHFFSNINYSTVTNPLC